MPAQIEAQDTERIAEALDHAGPCTAFGPHAVHQHKLSGAATIELVSERDFAVPHGGAGMAGRYGIGAFCVHGCQAAATKPDGFAAARSRAAKYGMTSRLNKRSVFACNSNGRLNDRPSENWSTPCSS